MYEDGEIAWREKRAGCFSASSLHLLMSKSGKFTDSVISYLYKIQRERVLGRPLFSADAPALRFGRENESYAVQWLSACTDWTIVYASDFDKADTFIKPTAFYGATPDVFILKRKNKNVKNIDWLRNLSTLELVEIKCVFSQTEEAYIFSPTVPHEDKRQYVRDSHGHQIAGQFLALPKVKTIWLLKYLPMRDEDEFDDVSPLDPSRGILFRFDRSEFDLEVYKKRLIFAEEYLNSGADLEKINEAWEKLNKDEKDGTKKRVQE